MVGQRQRLPQEDLSALKVSIEVTFALHGGLILRKLRLSLVAGVPGWFAKASVCARGSYILYVEHAVGVGSGSTYLGNSTPICLQRLEWVWVTGLLSPSLLNSNLCSPSNSTDANTWPQARGKFRKMLNPKISAKPYVPKPYRSKRQKQNRLCYSSCIISLRELCKKISTLLHTEGQDVLSPGYMLQEDIEILQSFRNKWCIYNKRIFCWRRHVCHLTMDLSYLLKLSFQTSTITLRICLNFPCTVFVQVFFTSW